MDFFTKGRQKFDCQRVNDNSDFTLCFGQKQAFACYMEVFVEEFCSIDWILQQFCACSCFCVSKTVP